MLKTSNKATTCCSVGFSEQIIAVFRLTPIGLKNFPIFKNMLKTLKFLTFLWTFLYTFCLLPFIKLFKKFNNNKFCYPVGVFGDLSPLVGYHWSQTHPKIKRMTKKHFFDTFIRFLLQSKTFL